MPMTVTIAIAFLGAILSHSPTVPEAKPAPNGPLPGTINNPLCGALANNNLRWEPKLGPLHISGTVVVGPDQSMILAAGTQVLASAQATCNDSTGLQAATTLLVAGGSLIAQGKPGHPVVFRPALASKGFAWGGIRADKAREGTVDLDWIEVRKAQTGVSFVAGAGQLRHAVVDSCGIGIASLAGAAPRILHSVVSRSLLADVVSERSAPLFRSCLFIGGQGDGMRFQGTGLARVESNCFWAHQGTDVVRGPEGLGGWRADSLPDRFGNRRVDPLLRGSESDVEATAKFRREMEALPWWKRKRIADLPNGSGPWALSPLSPLLGAGERGRCGITDGGLCDIGLWGGP